MLNKRLPSAAISAILTRVTAIAKTIYTDDFGRMAKQVD